MITSRGGVVPVFIFVMAIVVGKLYLHHNPGAWVDLVPDSWLSEDDKKVFKDPDYASKLANGRAVPPKGNPLPEPRAPQGWGR